MITVVVTIAVVGVCLWFGLDQVLDVIGFCVMAVAALGLLVGALLLAVRSDVAGTVIVWAFVAALIGGAIEVAGVTAGRFFG